MYISTVQARETELNEASSQPVLKFSKKRNLAAKWITENGRLVCRWVLI
jgi:hypothetical protein